MPLSAYGGKSLIIRLREVLTQQLSEYESNEWIKKVEPELIYLSSEKRKIPDYSTNPEEIHKLVPFCVSDNVIVLNLMRISETIEGKLTENRSWIWWMEENEGIKWRVIYECIIKLKSYSKISRMFSTGFLAIKDFLDINYFLLAYKQLNYILPWRFYLPKSKILYNCFPILAE